MEGTRTRGRWATLPAQHNPTAVCRGLAVGLGLQQHQLGKHKHSGLRRSTAFVFLKTMFFPSFFTLINKRGYVHSLKQGHIFQLPEAAARRHSCSSQGASQKEASFKIKPISNLLSGYTAN